MYATAANLTGMSQGLTMLEFMPFIGIISLIELIVVITYLVKRKPHGIARIICYIILVPTIWFLAQPIIIIIQLIYYANFY
jgi:hypothetical protein